ncbi:GCN5 family acetyltransferase [Micromonospora rosaria]|uniref:GCN5 family acetyltransferase n=1 Tax=Micromonospora rosaria TaxID=47874 RepID=A0A136PLI2_9ACTN|nr:GNAT family N-acetyltransferase [Micromonospora rosaria]KXK59315.1 GCN5 family acetyltransferase [Micromonospora rosaria]
MEPVVRPYAPTDLAAVYDICVRTADAGGDARGQYASDLLMGDVYAAPYVTLEPEHAHILDDGTGRAVGYVVGTADTPTFVRRYRAEWIPRVAGRYPPPADPPVTPEDVLLAVHHHPEGRLVPALAAYPAHLHIDLLPDWQGRGLGRRLMARFLAGLRAAGVPAVHLGMAAGNTGARRFYERLGFTEAPLPAGDPLLGPDRSTLYLVRSTAPLAP